MSNVFHLADYKKKPISNTEERIVRQRKLLEQAEQARQLFLAMRAPSATNLLVSATPVLLYHVSWGRNAWQAKWIARYRRNTLCESLASAQKFVNARLKQGSAYRLLITPGWHMQFNRKAYLVGDINTSTPFSRLVEPTFLQKGVGEIECLKLLNPSSQIWAGATPGHDSIVVQETSIGADKYVAWSAHSTGPRYVNTPGRYQRVIAGNRWYFAPVYNPTLGDFDTSRFASFLVQAQDESGD